MTIEYMKKNYGYFVHNGKEFILIQQAYLSTDAFGCPCYESTAFSLSDKEDEDGYRKAYNVIWRIKDNYDPECMEEDMACDWSNPYEVKESGEYSIEDNILC